MKFDEMKRVEGAREGECGERASERERWRRGCEVDVGHVHFASDMSARRLARCKGGRTLGCLLPCTN